MSQNCNCEIPAVEIPVIGLKLSLPESAFSSSGGNGDGIDYSLDEQWTGRRWIDGNKIYQKTVNFGQLPNNAVKKQPHGIVNMKDIVDFRGRAWYKSSTEEATVVLPHVNYQGSANYCINISIFPDTINILTWNAIGTLFPNCYVTIFYTCTDR